MKLRMGVIGTGMAWERLHYPAIKELGEQYEVVALCDEKKAQADCAAQKLVGDGKPLSPGSIYEDYNELLKRDDLDVVDLAVPITENFDIAKEVLKAGKNLIAEKPFAATIQGAEELINLKNRKNLKVMVAENYRYDEANRLIKDLIARGQIGEPTYFIFNNACDFEKDMQSDSFAAKEWRQHPHFKSGIFFDSGIHDIALMRFLFGDPVEIHAFGKPQSKEYCPFSNINCLFRFKQEIIGNYSYSNCKTELQKPPIGLRIFGTTGDIYLESKECGTVNLSHKDGRSEQKTYTPGRGYYNEFLDYYKGNIESSPEEELGDIKMVFGVLHRLSVF